MIAFLEGWSFLDLAIVEPTVVGCSFDEIELQLLVNIVEFLDQIIRCGAGRTKGTGYRHGDRARMVAVVCEEGGLAGRCMDGVVVCELSKRKEILPVVLLVVAEGAQVLLEDLVDALGLAVGLRVERRRHVGLYIEEGKEMAPEVGREQLIAVGHNVGGKAVEAMHILEEELGNVGSVGCGLGRGEMGHFGEAIDGDKDGIMVGRRRWQSDNEIHGDRLPWTFGHRERHQMAMGLVTGCFGAGACITGGDVAVHKASKARPEEGARDDLECLGLPKVSGSGRVVALAENPDLDRIVVGDIHEAVEEHEVVTKAEASEVLLDGIVSGHLRIAKERLETLESRVLLLGSTDVADELGLIAVGGGWQLQRAGAGRA